MATGYSSNGGVGWAVDAYISPLVQKTLEAEAKRLNILANEVISGMIYAVFESFEDSIERALEERFGVYIFMSDFEEAAISSVLIVRDDFFDFLLLSKAEKEKIRQLITKGRGTLNLGWYILTIDSPPVLH